MALHLVRIRLGASESAFDGCASFFEDWLKAEGLRLGQKTGGKKCKRLIVEPVLRWWLDVSPNQKRIEDVVGALHLPLALLLAKEIDRVSWLVSSQMRQNKL
ncbi:hypothetical protein [Caudoviricetes sp.]|nr:hypothetical protein [Caudoviricetes sp.]